MDKQTSLVQSILFRKGKWTPGEASSWLNHHGFKGGAPDETKNYYRYRQNTPVKGMKYRIKGVTGGISFVIGFKG